jgi:hypothetical protein
MTPVGVEALGRMLARRLERDEPNEVMAARVEAIMGAAGDPQDARRLRSLVLFDVPGRLKGLAVTASLCLLWETVLPWLGGQVRNGPDQAEALRDVSVLLDNLGDVYVRLGRGRRRWRSTPAGWRSPSGCWPPSPAAPTTPGTRFVRAAG